MVGSMSVVHSDAVATAPLPPFYEPLTAAKPPCEPRTQLGTAYAHIKVGPEGAARPASPPQGSRPLLGTHTVILSLACIVSAIALVCAANKWYEFLFLYSSPVLEEYRERQALHEQRQEAQRRAAVAAAIEEEADYRRRVEELYTSIASTNSDHGNIHYGSESSGSSPEIHSASPSSVSSFGTPSPDHHHGHFGRQMLVTARELHSSRWLR